MLVDWLQFNGRVSESINNEGTITATDMNNLFEPPFDWSPSKYPRGESSSTSVYLNLGDRDVEKVLCHDLNEAFPQDNVRISVWDYFAPFIANNPLYRDKIIEWFGSPDNIYGTLLHFLFKPKQELQDKIDKFVSNNFRKYNVGLHLRRKGNVGYVMGPQHEEVAWQCAGVTFGDGHYPLGALAIRDLEPDDVAIFLATDNEDTANYARKKYGNKIISITDEPITRTSVEGLQRAVVDMWILSLCDELVLSFQSSYGRVASALSGIVPLVVTHEGRCMREINTEPCSCGWVNIKQFPCYNSTIHDAPYMVNQVGCTTCDTLSRWNNKPKHG